MTSKRTAQGIALRALAVFVAGSVLGLSGGPVQAMPRGDWTGGGASLPQSIQPRVRLHTADQVSGRKRIRGLLESVDKTSITLKLRGGDSRTIEQAHVRKVAVPRKLSKRYAGWIVLGVTIAAVEWYRQANSKRRHPPIYCSIAGLSGLAF